MLDCNKNFEKMPDKMTEIEKATFCFVLFYFTISSLILPRVTVTAEFLFFLCENLVYIDRHPFATAKSLTLSIIISIS